MNCDKCDYFRWYYNWCDKWKCEVHWKSVCSFFKEDECEKTGLEENKC